MIGLLEIERLEIGRAAIGRLAIGRLAIGRPAIDGQRLADNGWQITAGRQEL
jgi:hypothetical protein